MKHLTPYQRDKINGISETYKSVFAKDKYDVGSVKTYEARIDLLVDTYCSRGHIGALWKTEKKLRTKYLNY